jgi:HSP20 family protein
MSIIPWNPLREFSARRRALDRLFGEGWQPIIEDIPGSEDVVLYGNSVQLDVYEDDQTYTVKADLPGLQAQDIHVSLDRGYLVLEGELPKAVVEEKKGKHILMAERHYGKFCRGIRLMEPVDESKAEATYQDGVLTVVLPKAEAKKAQVIPIQVSAE